MSDDSQLHLLRAVDTGIISVGIFRMVLQVLFSLPLAFLGSTGIR